MTINKIILSGRLARDPELRELSSNTFVCKIVVATDYTYKNKDGLESKEVCFTECVVWNKQAERCGAALKKGSMVTVEGRLKQENWIDKDSAKERTKHVVAASAVVFMEPRGPLTQEPVQQIETMLVDELPF